MIGTLAGIVLGLGVIAGAAAGDLAAWSIGGAVVAVLIGLVFPMTVGITLTWVSFASIIGIIAALISGHPGSALTALGIAVLAFAGQFVIGAVRRDAVA